MTTPTPEEITNKIYGDAIRALRNRETMLFTCIHTRPELKEGMPIPPPEQVFMCPLHVNAGILCKACISDHGYSHTGRGCDYCGAQGATWDALPIAIEPVPDDATAAMLDALDPKLAEGLRFHVHLLGVALCAMCVEAFDRPSESGGIHIT